MRFIKFAVAATIYSFVFFVSTSSAADVAKIGVFDFQKFLEKSKAGKAAQAEISKQGKKMEADLKEKGAEIEEIKKRLEREALVMDKDMREEKERDYRIKLNDIKVLQKKYMEDFKGLQGKLIKRLQKEIFEIVKDMGKKESYLLIVEKLGVLYHPNSIDITDKIIQISNAQYDKKQG